MPPFGRGVCTDSAESFVMKGSSTVKLAQQGCVCVCTVHMQSRAALIFRDTPCLPQERPQPPLLRRQLAPPPLLARHHQQHRCRLHGWMRVLHVGQSELGNRKLGYRKFLESEKLLHVLILWPGLPPAPARQGCLAGRRMMPGPLPVPLPPLALLALDLSVELLVERKPGKFAA